MADFQRSLETILRGHEQNRRSIVERSAGLQEHLLDRTQEFEAGVDHMKSVEGSLLGPHARSERVLDQVVSDLGTLQSEVASLSKLGRGPHTATAGLGTALLPARTRDDTSFRDMTHRALAGLDSTAAASANSSLTNIKAAERRLERSIQRVRTGKPLWGATASRIGVEAALDRQRDALLAFKDKFESVRHTVVKNAEEARQQLISETRHQIEEVVRRNLTIQLEECRRLEDSEIAVSMTRVAADCSDKLDMWMDNLRTKLEDEQRRAEAALKDTFTMEAENMLVEVAKLAEEERTRRLDALTEELQAHKNRQLALASQQLAASMGDGTEGMRERAEEELKLDLLKLRDRMYREQDDTTRAMRAELQASHDKAMHQAETALAAANQKALSELRERMSREHQDAMQSLAQRAVQENEDESRRVQQELEREFRADEEGAVAEIRAALKRGRSDSVKQLRRSLLSKRESAAAMLRAKAAEEEREAVTALKAEMEADTQKELSKLKVQLDIERADRLATVRRESEEERARHLDQLTQSVVKEKEDLTATALKEVEAEHREKLEELRAQLMADQARSEAALKSTKEMELQDALRKLETRMLQEKELALHDADLRFNAMLRKAEADLRELVSAAEAPATGTVSSAVDPIPSGVPQSVRRWLDSMARQFDQMRRQLDKCNRQLILQARQLVAAQHAADSAQAKVSETRKALHDTTIRDVTTSMRDSALFTESASVTSGWAAAAGAGSSAASVLRSPGSTSRSPSRTRHGSPGRSFRLRGTPQSPPHSVDPGGRMSKVAGAILGLSM